MGLPAGAAEGSAGDQFPLRGAALPEIIAWLRCQEREGVPCSAGHRPPQAGEAEPVLTLPGEFPLRFRRFRSGELEKMRGRGEAPSDVAPIHDRQMVVLDRPDWLAWLDALPEWIRTQLT